MDKNRYKLNLTINNCTNAQVIALVRMFEYIRECGNVGTSRWISFFADGDGDCRLSPGYEIIGKDSDKLEDLIYHHQFNYDNKLDDDYSEHKDIKIDYDNYAWELNNIENERFS